MHVPPDAGISVFLVGDIYTVLLNAANTGGNLSMAEAIVPAKAGPPMHTQHQEAESFLVMDGELVITAENEEYKVSRGWRGVRTQEDVAQVLEPERHQARQDDPAVHPRRPGRHVPRRRHAWGARPLTPPLNDADVAAMGAAGQKHNYTLG